MSAVRAEVRGRTSARQRFGVRRSSAAFRPERKRSAELQFGANQFPQHADLEIGAPIFGGGEFRSRRWESHRGESQ